MPAIEAHAAKLGRIPRLVAADVLSQTWWKFEAV